MAWSQSRAFWAAWVNIQAEKRIANRPGTRKILASHCLGTASRRRRS